MHNNIRLYSIIPIHSFPTQLHIFHTVCRINNIRIVVFKKPPKKQLKQNIRKIESTIPTIPKSVHSYTNDSIWIWPTFLFSFPFHEKKLVSLLDSRLPTKINATLSSSFIGFVGVWLPRYCYVMIVLWGKEINLGQWNVCHVHTLWLYILLCVFLCKPVCKYKRRPSCDRRYLDM